MATKHTSFLQYLLLLLITLASCDDQFLFSGFTQSSLNLDGCAIVTNGGLLDLTNGSATLSGHAFYPNPLHFRESPDGKVRSFSVNVAFSIFNTYPDLSADGMAFFIAPTKNFSDARAGKYFGLLDEKNNGDPSNQLFMVELDTYKNAEFQDINDNHVGINILLESSVFEIIDISHKSSYHMSFQANNKNLISRCNARTRLLAYFLNRKGYLLLFWSI